MRGFIKIVESSGVRQLINIAHIKVVWEQPTGQTSLLLQGDKQSEYVTSDISLDDFKRLLEEATPNE